MKSLSLALDTKQTAATKATFGGARLKATLGLGVKKGMTRGKPTQMRFTQRLSTNSMSFRLEEGVGDAPFEVVMEGKQIREK